MKTLCADATKTTAKFIDTSSAEFSDASDFVLCPPSLLSLLQEVSGFTAMICVV